MKSKEKFLIEVDGLKIYKEKINPETKKGKKGLNIIIKKENSDWKLNKNRCGPKISKIFFIKD